jgi:hypothetical protein
MPTTNQTLLYASGLKGIPKVLDILGRAFSNDERGIHNAFLDTREGLKLRKEG